MQRAGGQCFIQVEAAFVDRMRAMRRPGECYSSSPCRAWKRDAQPSGAEARAELQAVGNAVRDAQYTAYLAAERGKTDKAIAESMALLAKLAAGREGRPWWRRIGRAG